jgi:hypothetical protein
MSDEMQSKRENISANKNLKLCQKSAVQLMKVFSDLDAFVSGILPPNLTFPFSLLANSSAHHEGGSGMCVEVFNRFSVINMRDRKA